MPLPRPASPRALWADIRAFAAQRSAVQWWAAGFAVAMPMAIVVLFITDARTNTAPPATIVYVESWRADRTDAEIIADQKRHQAKREKAAKERQEQFKKLDERLERIGL
jgi:uncharacterized protein YraI